MHIVWFKKDLRLFDHAPLKEAIAQGSVLPLYIVEPKLWQQPDMSQRQYEFLLESLEDLQQALSALNHSLVIRVGEVTEVLTNLAEKHSIQALWSHQETGNGWTYQRDLAVKEWVKKHDIPWHELIQNGVVRGGMSRDKWLPHWEHYMNQPLLTLPKNFKTINLPSDPLPSAIDLGLANDQCKYRQKGGRQEGLKLLNSFLFERGESYSKAMSSPVTAFDSCSRLSPHLTFGTLSIREVFQKMQLRRESLKDLHPDEKGTWPSALYAFNSRLHWHCHFIQKLEDEPRIEFENVHSAYNGLREKAFNEEYFNKWCEGKTGYPMIDACMRALIATGWLNFRMRAMLISFASYHLWLHWRQPSLHLARLFTDYEPGIHYSQCQMQSGTTGINALRIYNPIKQGFDQDPEGVFIKQWLPELADIPQGFIHTPWQSSTKQYPIPLVDEKVARSIAKRRLNLLRESLAHQEEAQHIVKKHTRRKQTKSKKKIDSSQLEFDL